MQSGERERLKQLLRERLIECGWRDELKEQCKRIVKVQPGRYDKVRQTT